MLIRRSNQRGESHLDWLDSHHTFSFADYHDPKFTGFGSLRVINEDTVQAGKGFSQHPHKNMEIISYVIAGALEHKDSLGTGSIIRPGEIQRMSAGTGIEHSEFNHSNTELLHFLQIWIIPEAAEIKPSYEQKSIKNSQNQLILIGCQDQSIEAITIHQDVKLFVAYLSPGATISYDFINNRRGWLQLIKGEIKLNKTHLSSGDGVGIENIDKITITCLQNAELLLFDLN